MGKQGNFQRMSDEQQRDRHKATATGRHRSSTPPPFRSLRWTMERDTVREGKFGVNLAGRVQRDSRRVKATATVIELRGGGPLTDEPARHLSRDRAYVKVTMKEYNMHVLLVYGADGSELDSKTVEVFGYQSLSVLEYEVSEERVKPSRKNLNTVLEL
ncbi:hypothetical protein EVAR_65139_1 [Eumeta japonica]|uniref:Uncharacterized protein n=1 Tax=Eumeta variegata TaxID=151549 RepID=A0A4C1ZZD2_EUMVA|nr:hypothetical protein EVAR_65139_1 [Eumeta japonica]